jgi:hypothetical protein
MYPFADRKPNVPLAHPAGVAAIEIVRQQWNFSPGGSTTEFEDHMVNLDHVSALELAIRPDNGRGCYCEKVGAISPIMIAIHQPNVRFVNECRCLQGVVWTFVQQMAPIQRDWNATVANCLDSFFEIALAENKPTPRRSVRQHPCPYFWNWRVPGSLSLRRFRITLSRETFGGAVFGCHVRRLLSACGAF